MPLRDYQQEALDALENYVAIETDNPLVVMPTGSGKSHVIAEFVRHMNQQKNSKLCLVRFFFIFWGPWGPLGAPGPQGFN